MLKHLYKLISQLSDLQ